MESNPTPTPLRLLADKRDLLIGAAVNTRVLFGTADPRYAETLTQECNACVAENCFKPSEVWRGPRDYRWDQTDALMDWAETHGLTLRGHTLVWHSQTPRWLTPEAAAALAPSELAALLRDYIHAVVGRYKGRVAHWDVVNEAVTDPNDNGLVTPRTDSLWYRTLGPGYLAQAFRWAHEADPDALLYYNDYEIEEPGPKSDAVYALLTDLLRDGVPLNGIGFQAHLVNGWRASNGTRANLRRFAGLGLDWLFTEADVRMRLDGALPTAAQLNAQADAYADLTDLCLTIERGKGLIVWGITDKYSWIPGFRPGEGAALPLDEHYRPKPAYTAIAQRLAGG